LVAPTGVATGDTSDRLLHSETFQLENPYFAASQRSDPRIPRDAFRRPRGGRSLPGPCDPCPSSRTVCLSRPSPPVRRRAGRPPGSSGPPDANETGENRVSRRDSHFGDRCERGAVALSSTERVRVTTSDTPVASSLLVSVARFWRCPRRVARRPPRPVPRGPRERRALPRSRVSSFGSDLVQPARTEARTNPRCLRQSHGVHVMWIAWPRRIAPLHQELPPALTRGVAACG
jgi:hypothetical protein